MVPTSHMFIICGSLRMMKDTCLNWTFASVLIQLRVAKIFYVTKLICDMNFTEKRAQFMKLWISVRCDLPPETQTTYELFLPYENLKISLKLVHKKIDLKLSLLNIIILNLYKHNLVPSLLSENISINGEALFFAAIARWKNSSLRKI